MRVLIPIFLALLLAVTSVTFATARVQSAGLTQMVICAQGAERVVSLDAAGNPVETLHHCPDCLAALPPIPPVLAPACHRPTVCTTLLVAAEPQNRVAGAVDSPSARGPPSFV